MLQFIPMYIGSQRIGKIIKPKNQSTGALLPQLEWDYTWYVRDAQGNPMAIYTQDYAGAFGGDTTDYVTNITLAEQTIYGSSRLGLLEQNLAKQSTFSANTASNSYGEKVFVGISSVVTPSYTAAHITNGQGEQIAGQRRYELTNHLGNVLAVVSDRKIGVQLYEYTYSQGNGTYTWNIQANEYIYTGSGSNFVRGSSTTEKTFDVYLPQVMSYSDYYPFLMKMPDRFDNAAGYRYQGQGQEEDNEHVEGFLAFEYRIHDPRIGRFLSIDPLKNKFPHNSTYAFSENIVINCVEFEGTEAVNVIVREYEEYDPTTGLTRIGTTSEINYFTNQYGKGDNGVYQKYIDAKGNVKFEHYMADASVTAVSSETKQRLINKVLSQVNEALRKVKERIKKTKKKEFDDSWAGSFYNDYLKDGALEGEKNMSKGLNLMLNTALIVTGTYELRAATTIFESSVATTDIVLTLNDMSSTSKQGSLIEVTLENFGVSKDVTKGVLNFVNLSISAKNIKSIGEGLVEGKPMFNFSPESINNTLDLIDAGKTTKETITYGAPEN